MTNDNAQTTAPTFPPAGRVIKPVRGEGDELAGLAAEVRDYFDDVDAAVAAITPNEIEVRLAQLLNGAEARPSEVARQLLADADEPAEVAQPAATGHTPGPEGATMLEAVADVAGLVVDLIAVSQHAPRSGGRHAAGPSQDQPSETAVGLAHRRLDLAEARAEAAEARAAAAAARAAEAEDRASVAEWEATVARVRAETTTKEAEAVLREALEYRNAAVERAGRILKKAREQAEGLTTRARAELEHAMVRATEIVADANTLADYIRTDSRSAGSRTSGSRAVDAISVGVAPLALPGAAMCGGLTMDWLEPRCRTVLLPLVDDRPNDGDVVEEVVQHAARDPNALTS